MMNSLSCEPEFYQVLKHLKALKLLENKPFTMKCKNKDGETVQKIIDDNKNNQKKIKLANIVNKDNADEIFTGAVFGKRLHLMEFENHEKKIKIKERGYELK